jgi:hypothetical protein
MADTSQCKTRKVPLKDYYMTVYLNKSGGFFSSEGTPESAKPLLELEPDAIQRLIANGHYRAYMDGYVK